DALSREPTRYKILFVGGGKSVGELQKIVRTRYPELDVEFVGSIDYKLIANYYRLCDVVFAWYPPRENVKRAIAVKVFEACSLGVPIIVNSGTLMEDFVKEYKCGIPLRELRAEEIVNALENMPKIKKSLSSFKGTITNKWKWDREVKKLCRVYEWIVNLNP
ncbi:glycosyltransferase, partial [Thermococcus alcaliphilus]|uniref:glycosyltransferase n=1 Tax=Thermococcus alcaliphilus TaxID=139207 RepID=UPI0020908DA2